LPDKSNFANAPRSAAEYLRRGQCGFHDDVDRASELPDKVYGDLRRCHVGVHQTYLAIVIGRCAAMS
jgi:hypothetical protein